jgi:hypothetical protein
MKKLFFFFTTVLSFSLLHAQTQTADDVINRFTDANGGKDRLAAITTLQVQSSLSFGPMAAPVTIIKEKDKLFRIQSGSPMGGGDSFTILTDTAGYAYTPSMPGMPGSGFNGMDATLIKFTPEELAAQQYQKDCAGYFAALVDYAAKGSTAELVPGTEKVNGVDCDKVKLKLKSGQELLFFIATGSGQVRRMRVTALTAFEMLGMSGILKMMGGGRASSSADRKVDIDFDKYKIFDGFPFPTKQNITLGAMDIEIENTSFKVNQVIDPKWYAIKAVPRES